MDNIRLIGSNNQYQQDNAVNFNKNTQKYTCASNFKNPIQADSFELKNKQNKGFDYSVDDGKISFGDKLKSFAKGVISPITTMFSSPKNFMMGAAMIAGGAALMVATGGAAAPALVAIGVVSGGVQFAKGAYKAATAKTDNEAQKAWENIGTGTSTIAMSVAGAKGSLKAAGIKNTNAMNPLQATISCFKNTPKSITSSIKNLAAKNPLLSLQNIANQAQTTTKEIETGSKTPKLSEPKTEIKKLTGKKEPLLIEEKSTSSISKAQTPSQNQQKFKLSQKSLEKGSSILAEKGTPEYEAVTKIADEGFVVIKDKNSAIELMQKQHSSLNLSATDDVYVLNPNDLKKVANKKIGRSNEYMSKWYAEANNLTDKLITRETLQEAISQSASDTVTIVIPDDCSITGGSMIMETARAMNNITIPEGKQIRLVFSPMIDSPAAKNAFNAVSSFNLEELTSGKIIGQRDVEAMELFLDKFSGKAEIITPSHIIEAKPYNQTQYYIELSKNNPDLAQAVDSIMTCNGTRNGFGRPGTSGTMIATPTADGITLKCPNNNAYGAVPYALSEGATPQTIKRVNPSQPPVKKWHSQLDKMQQIIEGLSA